MRILTFKPTSPIREPITKFGGQPVWISVPQWPVSRSTGQPMRFIAQIQLPNSLRVGGQQMAYIFMTDGEEYVDGTWEAEGGENAVILQPAPFEPVVEVRALSAGPTLQRGVDQPAKKRRTYHQVELAVELKEVDPQSKEAEHNLSRFLGKPRWIQSEEIPAGGPWHFLLQIDSASQPYDINFGDAGVAYVFLSSDGRQARFLWQCM